MPVLVSAPEFARLSNRALIAATALEHGLTIVSRDAGYFAAGGVARLDPFA